MTHPAHSRAIPSIPRPDRATVQPRQPVIQRALRKPPPLAKLTDLRTSTAVYGLSVLDSRGRVADRRLLRALSWQPGQRLSIRQGEHLIVMTGDDAGVFRVSASSLVFLPAVARRWLHLKTGDGVLLAAYPDDGVLVVHPPAVLDQLLAELHRKALDGESR
ncbi:hypothetical protein [Actinoplanes sp. RD1]|uniref:hypothetical protein n=1 Tax=Actinoplanes sp. RD1 TaxID=3064538 RepID=UPI002741C5FE|nr:hypothetical protein [Actinoplanes sp. RD1]